jgi:hypothetical protein
MFSKMLHCISRHNGEATSMPLGSPPCHSLDTWCNRRSTVTMLPSTLGPGNVFSNLGPSSASAFSSHLEGHAHHMLYARSEASCTCGLWVAGMCIVSSLAVIRIPSSMGCGQRSRLSTLRAGGAGTCLPPPHNLAINLKLL